MLFRCDRIHRQRDDPDGGFGFGWGAFGGALGRRDDGIFPWLVAACRAAHAVFGGCAEDSAFRECRLVYSERLSVVAEVRELLRGGRACLPGQLAALAEKRAATDCAGVLSPPCIPKRGVLLSAAEAAVRRDLASPRRRPGAVRGLRRRLACILDAGSRAFEDSDVAWESIQLGLGWGALRRAKLNPSFVVARQHGPPPQSDQRRAGRGHAPRAAD